MSTQRITGAEARYQTKFAIGLLKGMQDSKSNIRMGGTAGRRLKGGTRDGRLMLPSSYKTIYAGTVTADEVKKRRQRTKAARKANLRRRRGF